MERGSVRKKDNLTLLPIQIACYTGVRIGEVCGLTWQDINLGGIDIAVKENRALTKM